MPTCNNMVTVAVPTKNDNGCTYKLTEAQCQSYLSHQDSSYCDAHRNTNYLNSTEDGEGIVICPVCDRSMVEWEADDIREYGHCFTCQLVEWQVDQ